MNSEPQKNGLTRREFFRIAGLDLPTVRTRLGV